MSKFSPRVLESHNIDVFYQDVTIPFPTSMHGTFDLVHMSLLVWALTRRGWESALRNLRELLSTYLRPPFLPFFWTLMLIRVFYRTRRMVAVARNGHRHVLWDITSLSPSSMLRTRLQHRPQRFLHILQNERPLYGQRLTKELHPNVRTAPLFFLPPTERIPHHRLSYHLPALLKSAGLSISSSSRAFGPIGRFCEIQRSLSGSSLAHFRQESVHDFLRIFEMFTEMWLAKGELESPLGVKIRDERERRLLMREFEKRLEDGNGFCEGRRRGWPTSA